MNDQIALYQQRLNLNAATFSRIDHEDAMVAVVYKVTQPDGKQFILKICDRINDYLREVHFLKLFAVKLPVPQIIQVVEPDEHIDGAILMECLPGGLLQPKDLTESLAYEIGRCLASIHLIRSVPNYIHLISFLRLNKAIATIGFTVKRGTWKINNAAVYQFNRSFLETLFADEV